MCVLRDHADVVGKCADRRTRESRAELVEERFDREHKQGWAEGTSLSDPRVDKGSVRDAFVVSKEVSVVAVEQTEKLDVLGGQPRGFEDVPQEFVGDGGERCREIGENR